MDPAATSAIIELATDPEVLGAVVLLVSTVIGATERIGGQRFKTLRRVWKALQGKGAALLILLALGLGCSGISGPWGGVRATVDGTDVGLAYETPSLSELACRWGWSTRLYEATGLECPQPETPAE